MALDPRIIMSGQSPDVVGIMNAATIGGQQAREFAQRNALNGYLEQNGAQVMAGDQNALAGLANFGQQGLAAAQGVQTNALNMDATRLGMDQTRLGMENTRQNMSLAQSQESRLTRAEERQVQQHAASISREQRAQEAAQIEQTVAQGMAAQTPEEWDAVVSQMAPDLVGQFDNREMVASMYMSIADVMKRTDERNAPPTTAYITSGEGAEKLGLNPEGAYNIEVGPNGMSASPIGGGSGITVNNNMSEGGGVSDEFYKKADASQAETFGLLVEEGVNVPSKLAQIDELDRLLSESPAGVEAAFKSYLGKYGVQTEGLDTLQSAQSIINRLVPEQRPPGSGPMSDADLALFKSSLPRLINSPGGNRQVIETIRGIAVYQQQQAEIANRVFSREMTPADGRAALMALANPLQVQRRDGATVIGGGYTIKEID